MFSTRLISSLLAVTAVVFLPSVTTAQVMVWKPGQTEIPKVVEEPPAPPKQVVLYAAQEATPIIKNRFWVAPSLRNKGNVNNRLHGALLMYVLHEDRDELDQELQENQDDWTEAPLVDLPGSQLPTFLGSQAKILQIIHQATELSILTPTLIESEGSPEQIGNLQLQELQGVLNLASLVELEALLAIAEKRYDDAIQGIRSSYRLAEVLMNDGHSTTLGRLYASHLIIKAQGIAEKLSQQPDSPNLYWSLASVPSDFWELQLVVDGEFWGLSMSFERYFERFKNLKDESSWDKILVQSIREELIQQKETEGDNGLIEGQLEAGVAIAFFSDASRHGLINAGRSTDEVQKMSHAESILRLVQHEMPLLQLDALKGMMLPTHLRHRYITQALDQSQQTFGKRLSPTSFTFSPAISATRTVSRESLEVESNQARLLTFEALRAHAAVHEGVLPESLNDLSPLPAWDDPATGQPFEYRRETDYTATLRISGEYFHLSNEFPITMHP